MFLKKISIISFTLLFVLTGCSSAPSKGDQMYAKYATLIDALEAEDYETATAAFQGYLPVPEEEVVELSLDNWSDYFELNLKPEIKMDAQESIDRVNEHYVLELKPEYQGKCRIENGFVGYEYENVFCRITKVYPDGTYDYETSEVPAYYYSLNNELGLQSESSDLTPNGTYIISLNYYAFRSDDTGIGGYLPVKSAEEFSDIFTIKPENINIVTVKGTLIIERK